MTATLIRFPYGANLSGVTPHTAAAVPAPKPLRRPNVRFRTESLWLPLVGAFSGVIWSLFIALFAGWHWWPVAPVIVAAAYGSLLRR
jgi:cobalamin synthase